MVAWCSDFQQSAQGKGYRRWRLITNEDNTFHDPTLLYWAELTQWFKLSLTISLSSPVRGISMKHSPESCRYWKCPVRRSSVLCSVRGEGEPGEGGGWVWRALPLEQLSAKSPFWMLRYTWRCSSTNFRQFRCSWPQKTCQHRRREDEMVGTEGDKENNRRNKRWMSRCMTSALKDEVKNRQQHTHCWCRNTHFSDNSISFFFYKTGREAARVTLVITPSYPFLTLHNTTLQPRYLPTAFPFPCFIKGLLGVWTKEQESLSQKHFTHGAL